MNYDKLDNLDIFEDGSPDIFSKPKFADLTDTQFYPYVVARNRAMRIDLIAQDLYGDPNLSYELMIINDIMNPFSVKEGDIIYYCSAKSLSNIEKRIDIDTTAEQEFFQKELSSRNEITPNKLPVGVSASSKSSVNKGTRLEGDKIIFGN